MDKQPIWSQLIETLSTQPWLIALMGALVAVLCVFVGHFLTLQMNNKRGKSLEKGLYNELSLIGEYFKGWLSDLINEFEKPTRDSFSGFSAIDMSCVDALVTELVAANRIPTKDQRRLILSLKNKLRSIKNKDRQRDEASKWYEQKTAFNVSRPCTARLILDVIEVVYFLSKFVEEKKIFNLTRDESSKTQAEFSFERAGIQFDSKVWDQIYQYAPENS